MLSIFVVSMIVFAAHYTMQEGEIFGLVKKLKLGKLSDPLRDCPVCMTPWYGTLIYFFYTPVHSWKDWAFTIIPAMGLNVVLVNLFPDKQTPGIHQELGEICEGLTDIGQMIKPIAQEAQFNAGIRISNQVIAEASKMNKAYKKDGKKG